MSRSATHVSETSVSSLESVSQSPMRTERARQRFIDAHSQGGQPEDHHLRGYYSGPSVDSTIEKKKTKAREDKETRAATRREISRLKRKLAECEVIKRQLAAAKLRLREQKAAKHK